MNRSRWIFGGAVAALTLVSSALFANPMPMPSPRAVLARLPGWTPPPHRIVPPPPPPASADRVAAVRAQISAGSIPPVRPGFGQTQPAPAAAMTVTPRQTIAHDRGASLGLSVFMPYSYGSTTGDADMWVADFSRITIHYEGFTPGPALIDCSVSLSDTAIVVIGTDTLVHPQSGHVLQAANLDSAGDFSFAGTETINFTPPESFDPRNSTPWYLYGCTIAPERR